MYRGKTPLSARLSSDNTDYSLYVPEGISFSKLPLKEGWMGWAVYTLSDDSPKKKEIIESINAYNSVVSLLNNTSGLLEAFRDSKLCLSKDEIIATWGAEVANKIFRIEDSIYTADLYIRNDRLLSRNYGIPEYRFHAPILGDIYLTISGLNNIHYRFIDKPRFSLGWNFSDDARDFSYIIWRELEQYLPADDSDDSTDIPGFDDYYAWDQAWYSIHEPDKRLIKCMDLLEEAGFLRTFSIVPEEFHPCWYRTSKSECSLDFFILDKTFKKHPIICDSLLALLKSKEVYEGKEQYIIVHGNKTVSLSDQPTQLGGNLRTKTFGRLNCPSVVNKSKHTCHNQVFFEYEENAILTFFKPCGICMKELYRNWDNNKHEELNPDEEIYWGMLQRFYE